VAAKREKRSGGTETVKGIGVSPGVVIGPVYLLTPVRIDVVERELAPGEVAGEISRFEAALIETRRQLREIREALSKGTGAGDAAILDAHLMVLDDRTLIEEMVEHVEGGMRNVEFAVKKACDKYAAILDAMRDEYLRERVADVRDVGRRLIRNLTGQVPSSIAELPRDHVIVADDLAPSETASLRRDQVAGFATDLGSQTSHTAVMARALEIPAVVGLHDITRRVSVGDQLLLDGNKGIAIINPTSEQLEEYGRVAAARRSIERSLSGLRDEMACTRDGHRIVLSANMEGVEEIGAVREYGADGIGLYRTEFLFLAEGHMLSEQEQQRAYDEVARQLAPQSVIIRTVDLGGDKFFPEVEINKESNPFLGCRSIRLSLRHPQVFKQQLRAILRASAHGNVKVMYPMISNVEEVVQANGYLDEAKQELRASGIPFDEQIDVGVMIEIPGAAMVAEAIAQHVDFFSIGTNDLIQYTLAVDRGNERVAYLYEPTHPAVLKLIKRTVAAAHNAGIWAGVCGEMGADPLMAPLLLGLGVDEMSMMPRAVPVIKDVIRSLRLSQAQQLANQALMCDSSKDVAESCRELVSQVAPEILELT
jgi:phosphotransferase system enzyme I (PtsI)